MNDHNIVDNVQEGTKIVARGVLKSLLGSFPVGNTAVEIYNELHSKQIERKVRRLEEFYQSLDDKISAVEDRVNNDYINKVDFQDVFERATRYVVSERVEQKRTMFRNILANSIIAQDCDYDKTERYFRLLDNLTETELNILAVLDNPEQFNINHGMPVKDPISNAYQSSWNRATGSGILTILLGMKIHEIEDSITILFSNGLIIENFLRKEINTNANPIHVLDNLLTTKGKDFVKYLKG